MLPDLIETILLDAEHRLPLLDRHLARLHASCRALDYRWEQAAIEIALQQAVSQITTPGAHRLRLQVAQDGLPRIQTTPLPPLPTGQTVTLASHTLRSSEPWLRHKSTYRPWYPPLPQASSDSSADFDQLYFNERDELCEGSRSNVYLRLGTAWFTPPVDSGCLPGVQRAALLASQQAHTRVLTRPDLFAADAIRLSNALRGWFSVTLRID